MPGLQVLAGHAAPPAATDIKKLFRIFVFVELCRLWGLKSSKIKRIAGANS